MKRNVITLCGSIRFMDTILKMHEELELEGNVVIGIVQHVREEDYTLEEEDILDVNHKIKIDMSNEIFVVNVDGYIGKSTRSEIEYAKEQGKVIKYLVPIE